MHKEFASFRLFYSSGRPSLSVGVSHAFFANLATSSITPISWILWLWAWESWYANLQMSKSWQCHPWHLTAACKVQRDESPAEYWRLLWLSHQPWMAATQNTLSSSFTVECVTLSHLSSSRPCVRDHVCLSKTVEHSNKMLIITHYIFFSRNEGQCCQRPIVSFLKVDSHLCKYFLTAILCFRCVSPERACDIFHPNGL